MIRASNRIRPRIPSLLCLVLICARVQALDHQSPKKPSVPLTNLAEVLNTIHTKSNGKFLTPTPDGGFEYSWNWNKGGIAKSSASNNSKSSSSGVDLDFSDLAMVACFTTWLYVSWVALMSPHPDPVIAETLPLRHNFLMFSQAVAFQVPILVSAFMGVLQTQDIVVYRRLLLGIAVTSLWTGAGVFFGKTFSAGYELFSTEMRYAIGGVELLISFWAFGRWAKSVEYQSMLSRLMRGSVGSIISLIHGGGYSLALDNPDDTNSNDIALHTGSTIGLLILAIMPQFTSFPTATIPTILGKRFSRAASGVTFLAAVMAYCIRDAHLTNKSKAQEISTLKTGLAIGSIGHLVLVVGKIIGIDGGGLLIEGYGLWELYPCMVKADRAATSLLLVTFANIAFACTR